MGTADEEKAKSHLLDTYLKSFNAGNIEGIIESLDPEVQVCVEGTLTGDGRDTIVPSYLLDFEAKTQVSVTRAPVASTTTSSEGTHFIRVAIGLVSSRPGSPSTTLDVVYTYDGTTMKQVQHDISNVQTSSTTNEK
ncbi:unnamed protein product [Cylindrotheca closterium]|uniref:SnoaL-like domain-containing protein n=1 Tax=Cylindrotheca closterium TaxID=2856 RepID=A0AAD2FQG4_9STRA|nr:unnamed protein product [Cylindrotheca closterium]